MARKLRAKASTPEQIAAKKRAAELAQRLQDFDAVNLPTDAATLNAHADIDITRAGGEREGKRVEEDQARRLDAFEALKKRMEPGAYDAARRLEKDILTRFGETDKGRSLDRVDSDYDPNAAMMVRVLAGERVDDVLSRIGLRDQWLLSELIRPQVQRQTWREVVGYITGETHEHAQGAAVRGACANLLRAYQDIEASPRRAA